MTPAELDQLADAIACRVIERLNASSQAQPPDGFLDSHQAAELLGCSVPTIERLTRSGRLPSVKLGRLRRYRRSAVLEMSKGVAPSWQQCRP